MRRVGHHYRSLTQSHFHANGLKNSCGAALDRGPIALCFTSHCVVWPALKPPDAKLPTRRS